jgi:hypothetical protein
MKLIARHMSFALGASLLLPAPALPAFADDATYGYVFLPPPTAGSPRIRKVELNSDELHAGGTIAIRVTTTPDVVAVVTGNGKHQGSLLRVGRGVFRGDSTLPHIGGFLPVRVKLHFEATTADGREAIADVPVTYK